MHCGVGVSILYLGVGHWELKYIAATNQDALYLYLFLKCDFNM